MPTYSIKAPDGRTYSIQGPPGATDAQVRAEVLRQFPNAGGKPQETFSQAFFGKMGRDLAGLGNPALQAIAAPTINAIFGPNTVRDFTTRAVQPVTMGAADELVSAVPAVAAARRGQPVRQAASQSQREQSKDRDRIKRERPKLATAADLTGGALSVALPVPLAGRFIAGAGTTGGTALRTGLVGGVQGATTGFLGADEGERLAGMAGGAGVGAVTGAALPFAVAGLSNVGQRVAPIVQRFVQRAAPVVEDVGRAVPGVDDLTANLGMRMRSMGPATPPAPDLPTPEQIALRHLNRNLQTSGMTLDDLRAAPDDLFAAEAMGRTSQRQLGALARREGQTGDLLEQAVAERRLARPGVLQNEFARATGVSPEAAAGDIESIVDAGRRSSAPLYDAAYQDPIEMTPVLSGLSSRPTVQRAMANARRMMLDDGLDPNVVGLEVSPASGDIPEMVRVTRPSLQTWDYVKRGLDDELERLRDTTTGRLPRTNQVRQITELAQTLRGELTRQSPNYRQALANSADYLSTRSAFDRASSLLSNNRVTEREFATAVGRMTDTERAALRAGAANWAFDLVQTGRMTPRVLAQPRIRAKLTALLGEEGAGNLIATAEREMQKAAFENRYGFVNSTTDELRAAGQELDEGLGGTQGRSIGRALMNPLGTARDLGAQAIDFGVRMAQTGQVPARDALGRAYTMSPRELADYLAANPINLPPPVIPRPNAPNPFRFTTAPPRTSQARRP